jgi:carbamoyl-phosphate synthase large subunit
MQSIKAMGFSDSRLASIIGKTEDYVRNHRHTLSVFPVYKRVDTCAAEFISPTPYMYSTYGASLLNEVDCESKPTNKNKVIILGGGPNRIGQGIEFDYCCCHACYSLTEQGYETIMINCNPETVSTDYDTSDRLYFEPLTFEHVMEIMRVEQENGTLHGVIVQFGGQTPLKLASSLEKSGIPILGTSPDAIDLAEDRERFQALVTQLKLKQPNNGLAHSSEEAFEVADKIGFPLVIRPSYVLGGRAMEIVRDQTNLERYISEAVVVSGDSPVLLDSYLSGAIEIDVDALCDGTSVHVAGIMQHIEEAGVHSGDSACSLPPYSLSQDIIVELKRQTKDLALSLNVVGLMNVQFAIKDGEIYLIEVNPRASRTVPFVAKAVRSPIAAIAARIMAGEKLKDFNLIDPANIKGFAVKEAVLPFARFPGVDTLLGPEMRSTGEVMGFDSKFHRAFYKAQLGAGTVLPKSGKVFLSIKDEEKDATLLELASCLLEMDFTLTATRGTASFLAKSGIKSVVVNKVYEGRPNIVDQIKNGDIALIFNTTAGTQAVEDSRSMRASALMDGVPYFTTISASHAAAFAIKANAKGDIGVKALQE